jgi:hypothetical protein
MRSDKFDKRDAPAEIESNNHPKISAGNFEPCSLPVQDLCVWSRKTNITIELQLFPKREQRKGRTTKTAGK